MGKDKEDSSFALGEKLLPQRFPLPSSGTLAVGAAATRWEHGAS